MSQPRVELLSALEELAAAAESISTGHGWEERLGDALARAEAVLLEERLTAQDNVCSMCRRRLDISLWDALPEVGQQSDGEGGLLDLRNCLCGTTLARPAR